MKLTELEEASDIVKIMKKLRNRDEEMNSPGDVSDIKIMLSTDFRHWNMDQVEEIKEELIKQDYIKIDGDVEDNNSEITDLQIERFKEDIDYQETFELPEELDKPRNSDIAHHFTPFIVDHYDVRAVLLDVESNNYELWSYDKESKTWKANGLQRLREIAPQELQERYTKSLRKEIEERLKTKDVIDYGSIGAPENYVAVDNGLLNLEEFTLQEIEKEDYIVNKLPVNYKPEREIPEIWKEYLEEVQPKENVRKMLQEFAGYSLMSWTAKHERGLMLLGPTDSGKSVFLDVMRNLLGGENIGQESLQNLANTDWAIADLKGKMANIDHDLDPSAVENVGRIKKLTSGNDMKAERKFEKKFDIKPTAKLMFSANQVPDRNYEQEAVYNRWLTATFPKTIPPSEQDKDLINKLTTKENLEGILNWALEGLKRLEEQQQFTNDLDPLSTKELWKEWGNSVERFISNYCITKRDLSKEERQERDLRSHVSTVYQVYQEFAVVNGFEVETKKGFTQQATQTTNVRRGRPSIDGNQERGFFGLELKEDAFKTLKDKPEGEGRWAD